MANDFDSDAMLAFVAELTKRFEDLKKTLADIGNQTGTGMKKAGDEVERFGAAVKKHAGTSVKEMNVGLKEMATTILGPVGLVVGISKVGEALSAFATGQMRIQNFARDTGFAATSVEKLRAAGEHMGYTVEETNEILKNFSGAVNDLHIDRQASALWRDLGRIRDGGYQVAQTIERMKTEGKDNAEIQAYAADLIVRQLRRQTDEGNRAAEALSQAFKIPISYALQLAEAKKKISDDDILILTPEQRKKQEEYNDEWLKMKRKFWKELSELETTAIDSLVDAQRNYQKAGTFKEWWQRTFGGGGGGTDDDRWAVYGDSRDFGKRTPLDVDERNPVTGLPFGARELVDTQKESKGYLQQIRDILASLAGFGGEAGGSPGAPGGRAGVNVFRPGVNVGGRGGGAAGGPGTGTTGANYFRGMPNRADMVTVDTAAGPITVHKDAAGDIQGFVNDMIAAGAPKESIGSYSNRNIAGTNRLSQHAFGGAIDYGQRRRNVVDPAFQAWANQNPQVLRDLLQKHHMISGGDWRNPDFGHFEWNPNAGYHAPTSGAVRGSTFNDARTASGLPASVPGIALPTRATLGQMFKVTTPDGRTFMARQTDVGPAKWTGRGIDINRPLAAQMGYTDANFPTDSIFRYEPAGGALDRALRGGRGGDLGGAHITVDFNNAPRDVKTSAELMDTGVFKTLKLNRSAGQAAMAGQTTAPQNNWQIGE